MRIAHGLGVPRANDGQFVQLDSSGASPIRDLGPSRVRRRIALVFLSLASCAGFSTATACASLREMQAHRSEISPEDTWYAAQAVEVFLGDGDLVAECATPAGLASTPFALYFEVNRSGGMGGLLLVPETPLGKCIKQKTQYRIFPPPPSDRDYAVRMDLTIDASGTAVLAPNIEASTLGVSP